MHKQTALALFITLSCITFGAPNANAASYEQPLDRACRFQLYDGKLGWSTDEVERTIACAVRRWPVSLTTARAIAWRESKFHATALNASGCAGVYQWAPSTWVSVLDDFPDLYAVLGHGVFNARSNVMYAVKFAHNRSWSPWGM